MRAAIVILGAWLVVFAQDKQEPKKDAPPAKAAPKVEFKIPPEDAKRENPVKATDSSIAAGKRMFQTQCAMCHGADGNGKGELATVMELKLVDYTASDALKDFTDGELFYILNKGKGKMPGEEGRMPPTQQWNLINYIRSLAKKSGPPAKPIPNEPGRASQLSSALPGE